MSTDKHKKTFEENMSIHIETVLLSSICYKNSLYSCFAQLQYQPYGITMLVRCHRRSSDIAREPLAVVAAALRSLRELARGLERVPSALLCGNFAANVSLLSNAKKKRERERKKNLVFCVQGHDTCFMSTDNGFTRLDNVGIGIPLELVCS